MKVALCLHGKFDSQQDNTSKGVDGYQHIKNRIYTKCDPDIFIHSWDTDREEEIVNLYNPKNSIFEKQINFDKFTEHLNIPNPPRQPSTILSHFYSVSESIKLACHYSDYDIIIKARFDLGRINRNTSGPHSENNPYPVQCISFDPNLDMHKLHMANWQYLDSDGPADMWFYSNYDNMSKLSNLYQFALECFHDEEYVKGLDSMNDLPNAIKLYKSFYKKNKLWEKKNLLETTYE